jgi:hypothetical protein
MTLEQVLLKAYTDRQFRQRIQDGTEQLLDLTELERAAIKSMDFEVLNNSTPTNPGTVGCGIGRL